MNPKVEKAVNSLKLTIRIESFVLFALALGASTAVSWGLHLLGVTWMWQRYLVAGIVGYLAFLGLYRLWLVWISQRIRQEMIFPTRPKPKKSGDWGDGVDLPFPDLDELGVWLGVIALAVAAAGFVLWSPGLLLDLLTGEVLMAFLFNQLKGGTAQPVTEKLILKTWPWATLLIGLLVLWALALGWLVPGAGSFGEALKTLTA